MRAFIVRPFGPRNGIDFTEVQRLLVDPALAEAEIAGDTTMQFVEAGNIRVDMFEQLLLADLVIADISVHNANVFYELGIRHALRARQTILIRAKVTKPRADRTAEDEVPFDLRTDRYLEYDHGNPAASLPALKQMLTEMKAGHRADSPVFLSLPSLLEQDRSRFSPVPQAFAEEARQAADRKDIAHLGLLAAEAAGFTWEAEGWRMVGKMLFDLRAWPSTRRTLERVLQVDANDLVANLWLGTAYQWFGNLTASDQALDRVLRHPAATHRHKSEAFALKGSNEKVKWVEAWTGSATADRSRAAVESPFLLSAFESYEKAFAQDLNSFYPGLVALSLLTIRKALIDRHPDVWSGEFTTEAEETVARATLESNLAALAGAVRLALLGDRASEWFATSWADYQFLVADKPSIAVAAYRKALGAQTLFRSASARRQLQIFADLELKQDRIADCLAMFAESGPAAAPLEHAVVFTGHMIDKDGRATPRFPASCVNAARDEMRKRLSALKPGLGIAAVASGGDTLFHELCAELEIGTDVCLVMPPQLFVNESVVSAGQEWVDRFWALIKDKQAKKRFMQLDEKKELPTWLQRKPNYSIWNRANIWMLEYALSRSPERLTVMALWDGKKGDGPGGTADLLETAQKAGATPSVIKTVDICGTSAASQ